MEKVDFNIVKAKAEVYGREYVDNRVFLFGMNKDLNEIPADFKRYWDVSNGDVIWIDSMAEFVHRGQAEIDSAYECFLIRYYWEERDSFTFSQCMTIKRIITENIKYELEHHWANKDECFNDALEYRQAQSALMDEVDDLLN